MKEPKAMEDLHKIMEKFYEEDKNLSSEQKIKKIREESESFMRERGLRLRRMKGKQLIRSYHDPD
jgi:hypothetical protein